MKLVASVMVGPGEEDRYLAPFLEHLLQFCDEIRIRLEVEVEGPGWETTRWGEKIQVRAVPPSFFVHEGRARQELLMWTMAGDPTHILVIDADEFVGDGQRLRTAMEAGGQNGIWKLEMTEIWGANEQSLSVRVDGLWKPRPVGIAFEVPNDHWVDRQKRRHWRMPEMALACGRVPLLIAMTANRTPVAATTSILHLGWACKADRAARYARYEQHDGGKHHDIRHLRSIMYEDSQVGISPLAWPSALDKKALLARVNRV